MTWRWHQNEDLSPVVADEFVFTKSVNKQKLSLGDNYKNKEGKGGLRGYFKSNENNNTRNNDNRSNDNDPREQVTGTPVFASNTRGRRAAQFNAEHTRLYAAEHQML